MPVEVILPKVDMDMSHGTISVWHVAEGDHVEKGAALFDIETEKAAMEVEAPASGVLHHIAAAPGDRVAVGAPVAWIYAADEVAGPPPGDRSNGPGPVAADAPPPGASPVPAVGPESGSDRISFRPSGNARRPASRPARQA
jgi:pyruvate/2-oxoglutarate dehydrogenase complex dihydrolipoamide acyltransferase (E2) component